MGNSAGGVGSDVGSRARTMPILVLSLLNYSASKWIIEIESEILELEREENDPDKERPLRFEEREARDKLEKKKFKVMMETFASARK